MLILLKSNDGCIAYREMKRVAWNDVEILIIYVFIIDY